MGLLNAETIPAALLLAPLTGLLVTVSIADAATTLWFDRPAKSFHESLPLGNGRLGAMDLGGVDAARIILNESSVWSGGPYDANKHDAHQCLPEVREKLFAGDIAGAGNVLSRNFRYADGVRGWMDEDQFGCYQTLGDLMIEFGWALLDSHVWRDVARRHPDVLLIPELWIRELTVRAETSKGKRARVIPLREDATAILARLRLFLAE